MSLPPVRSRTRENPAATASSRQPLGGNGGAVPQRRASSARRRTGSSRKDATHKAAAAEATASAARTRVAWVNVVDGVPEPPSPPEAQAARRQGGRVLTRVPGMEASRGKENATQGQGTQRGVFLRRVSEAHYLLPAPQLLFAKTSVCRGGHSGAGCFHGSAVQPNEGFRMCVCV